MQIHFRNLAYQQMMALQYSSTASRYFLARYRSSPFFFFKLLEYTEIHEQAINHIFIKIKQAGPDVMQSHPMRGTHFGQYQASPAGLGWPGDGDYYLMHKARSGGWHIEEKGWPEASTMNDSASTLSMWDDVKSNNVDKDTSLHKRLTSVHLMEVIVILSSSVHYTESTTQKVAHWSGKCCTVDLPVERYPLTVMIHLGQLQLPNSNPRLTCWVINFLWTPVVWNRYLGQCKHSCTTHQYTILSTDDIILKYLYAIVACVTNINKSISVHC